MKKLFLSGLIIVGLNAYDLYLTTGWQLLGAKEDIDVTVLNNENVGTIWTYDKDLKKWFAYVPSNPSIVDNATNIGKLTNIKNGQGFWVYAKNNITIHTQIDYDVNISSFDKFVNGVTDISLDDISNKTFYMYSDQKISYFGFDSYGKATLESYDGKWDLNYNNGIIYGISEDNRTVAYKKLASDTDVLVVAGVSSDSENPWVDAWFYKDNSISPKNMATIAYPYTAYNSYSSTEYKVFTDEGKLQTYNYSSSSNSYIKTDEKSFTIEDGKIVVQSSEYNNTWSYDSNTITTVNQYYDKYQMLKKVGDYDIWLDERYHVAYYYDDNLKNKKWSDIVGSDIVIYYKYKLGNNGTIYVKDNNVFKLNSDYKYVIDGNFLTISKLSDTDFSYKFELDGVSGKVNSTISHFMFANIYSSKPIIK